MFNVGDRVGPYILEEKIGKGGHGIVFRARDTRPETSWMPVAIKVPRFAANSTSRERIQREANMQLICGHIGGTVKFIETLSVGGSPVVVMQLVEGRDLSELLKGHTRVSGRLNDLRAKRHSEPTVSTKGLPPSVAARIVIDVLSILQDIHNVRYACGTNAGIVYGDLKPANVIVTPWGDVKLLDFTLTMTAFMREGRARGCFGTPAYMSPEQAKELDYDLRADVFAVTTLLYELLVGERPWRSSDPRRVVRSVAWDQPATQLAKVASVAPQAHAIIKKGWDKNPNGRFASASELRNELLQLQVASRARVARWVRWAADL